MAVVFSEKKLQKVSRIDNCVARYFDRHPYVAEVNARKMMKLFIDEGIYFKDNGEGRAILKTLRELQGAELLHLFVKVDVVKKPDFGGWWFRKK